MIALNSKGDISQSFQGKRISLFGFGAQLIIFLDFGAKVLKIAHPVKRIAHPVNYYYLPPWNDFKNYECKRKHDKHKQM